MLTRAGRSRGRTAAGWVAVAVAGLALLAANAAQGPPAPRIVSANPAVDNWALDLIDGTVDGRFAPRADGAGVDIYVLDSGARLSHVDFAGRGVPIGTFTAAAARPVSADVTDCEEGFDGHGTHDASYAAGARYGVASAARVHIAKISGGAACDGSPDAARHAVDYIVAHHRRGVVNLSFAWPDRPERRALVASILTAMDAGFVFTLSAACTADVGRTWLQAATEQPQRAIIAAATDERRRSVQEPYAPLEYGPLLTLFAPGNHVLGASASSDAGASVQPPLDRARCSDSFAAPHVAGVAAAYLQRHPRANPQRVHDAIVRAAVPDVVKGSLGRTPNRFLRDVP